MLGVWHHTSSLPVMLSPNRVASSVAVASAAADLQQQQSNGAAAAALEPGKRKKERKEKKKPPAVKLCRHGAKDPLLTSRTGLTSLFLSSATIVFFVPLVILPLAVLSSLPSRSPLLFVLGPRAPAPASGRALRSLSD